MGEDQDEHAIYEEATKCLDLFELYLKSTGVTSSNHETVEELRGRFNLWAAYVGAFAQAKVSLDARLIEHRDIKDMVLELLLMIQKNLRYGKFHHLCLTASARKRTC